MLIILSAFITLVLWSSAMVAIRYSLHGYHIGSLALLRFLSASIAVIPFYCYSRQTRINKHTPYKHKDVLGCMLLGVLGMSIYNLALNHGEQTMEAGTASFIIAQIPVFTAVLALIILKERMNYCGWLGLAISIFGMFIVASHGHWHLTFDKGAMYVLAAALCMAAYTVLRKRFFYNVSAIDLTAFSIWGSLIALSALYWPELIADFKRAPLGNTLSAVYLGVFPTVISYGLWNYILLTIPASKVACTLYLMPLFATMLSWGLLHETPEFSAIVGGLIALIGAIIVTRFSSSPTLPLPGKSRKMAGHTDS